MLLPSSARAPLVTPPTGVFDPKNPFVADSAHHRPIGSGAVFAGAGSAFLDMWNLWPSAWGGINPGSPFGRVVHIVNSVTSPKVTINVNTAGEDPVRDIPAFNIPFPPSISFNSNTTNNDSVVVLIEEDTGRVHEFRECRAQSGFTATPAAPMLARSYRPHWAMPNGAATTPLNAGLGHGWVVGEASRVGHSASGISALFGLLTGDDLDRPGPIGHVLQSVFPSRVGDDGATAAKIVLGKSIILPAVTRDGFCSSAAYCTGPVPYGSVLSVDHGFNVYNFGFNALQTKFAECIRDYGIIAVDTGGGFKIRADQSVVGTRQTQLTTALGKLKPYLRLILNGAWDPNDRRKPTGGGTPRAVNTGYDA